MSTENSAVGHEPSRVHTRPSEDTERSRQSQDDELQKTPSTPITPTPGPGPGLKTISKLSPFGALLSRTLPSYKGPYPVGVFDIEIPVEEPRSIGSFRHKTLHAANPGFSLETVLFSVFYPAEDPPADASKVVWFPKLAQTVGRLSSNVDIIKHAHSLNSCMFVIQVNGFLKMARRTSWYYKALAYPIAAAAIYGTTFPAVAEAPLRKPSKTNQQWPLAIFSHGVGCSRLMYSSICGELASRGYIVCAIEHRDGTGPSSSIRLEDGTIKSIDFLDWKDLEWPDIPPTEQPENDTRLRKDQLEMRCAEVAEVIQIMKKISLGEPVVQTSIRSPHFDWDRWGPAWNAINPNKPIMVGHSLGGSAGLLAASYQDAFTFRSLVVMDPACQREQKPLTAFSMLCIPLNLLTFMATNRIVFALQA
jgi:platelet-activating factor acetylhydrolase